MADEYIGNQPGPRPAMVSKINDAMSHRNIRQTAARLGALAQTGDFLDICDAIGALAPIHGGNLPRYKRELPIPATCRSMLTAAFHTALTAQPHPVPLRLMIVSGSHETVHVTSTASEIAVVVTRDDTRKAPRKRAATGRKSAA